MRATKEQVEAVLEALFDLERPIFYRIRKACKKRGCTKKDLETLTADFGQYVVTKTKLCRKANEIVPFEKVQERLPQNRYLEIIEEILAGLPREPVEETVKDEIFALARQKLERGRKRIDVN